MTVALCGLLIMICLSACGTTETSSNPNSTQSESQSNTTQNTDESTVSEEIEAKLSNSCDKILASGYDANSNYYELVANEKEDYTGTKIEMGIIKNNEWVIPLTLNSPFVSESGLLVGAKGVFKGSIYEERFAIFNYIGAGCFSYESIIWNGNTKETYIPDGTLEIKGTRPFVNNDGLFIVSQYNNNYKLLDVNSMSIKEINLREDGWDIDYCFPYSEGLFACMNYSSDKETNGFYDVDGKKVIDLSKYKLATNTYTTSNTGGYSGPTQNLVFENGKCTFTITNDQGSDYVITIDKKGNVVNSVAK